MIGNSTGHPTIRSSDHLTIVGQGIAGTMLGWELENAGIDFKIYDAGHRNAASRVAAGIINPVTGRRLAKTWRVDELLPLARFAYGAIGASLGIDCWRDMRVRRLFQDDAERELLRRRLADSSVAPYVVAPADDEGFWIENAGVVDVRLLIEAARARWASSGKLVEEQFDFGASKGTGDIILCTGAEAPLATASVAKGEILTVVAPGLDSRTILNRGRWLLPCGAGEARVGATYLPGAADTEPTESSRSQLLAAARSLSGSDTPVLRHEAGVRLAMPDKRPVAGWINQAPPIGVLGALGSKGVLFAPWLAVQWRKHLVESAPFDPETVPS